MALIQLKLVVHEPPERCDVETVAVGTWGRGPGPAGWFVRPFLAGRCGGRVICCSLQFGRYEVTQRVMWW